MSEKGEGEENKEWIGRRKGSIRGREVMEAAERRME